MSTRPIVFNGKFLTAGPTGVHRVAGELIAHLDKIITDEVGPEWHDTRLITPRNALRRMDLKTIRQSSAGRFTGQPWEQFDLAVLSRKALLVNLCNLAPIAARASITMIHDAQVFLTPQSYSPAFRAFYRFALPRIGASAVKILTVSDYSRNELARFGVAPHSKIEVVHNGADHILSCQADPSIVARLGLEPYRYVVGLANTQVHKNISVLLKALALPAMKSARLVLVGKANKDDFEKLGHHVPANVLFAGPVSDEQLRALMEGAAALAFPSTTEGFGLPPAEAMHLGCPVVAAPLGALPEICGDAAVYAEPHDASAWSDAILGLIESHELRRKTSQAGYIQARKFTWAASARKLLNIVQDAILTDACGRTR